ncbi:hypothetical protein SUGI_0075700 [Cryptomeria japonica]|nr:hypothetical protein SUGI_0075700 [Cryptomeria japonica]
MDVKSAFLNGNLEEEVYMEQLEGFLLHDDETFVCQLKRALYGLKQAPKAWYSRLDQYLKEKGFKKGSADRNLCIKKGGNHMIIVVVYIDEIVFGGNKDTLCKEFADQMQSEFEMSMLGELTYFLGLQILQQDKGIFISQIKYAKEMLNKFQLEYCKPVSTPMATDSKLSKNDESPVVDQNLYRSMIGSLLYLTASRSNIIQAVCMVAKFQATPKQSHMNVVNRIFRYLQGMLSYGDQLVSWHNKKQDSVSLSTIKVEYIVVAKCFSWVLWMKRALKDIQVDITDPILIRCDNLGAINIVNNPVMHSTTRHIAIKYHFLRDKVEAQEVRMDYVPTREQVADIFTKPLPVSTFEYLRHKLGDVSSV